GEGFAAERGRARSRPARPVFHERARSRAADGNVEGVGAAAEAEGQRARAARSGEPEGIHAEGETHVRHGAAGVRDGLDAIDRVDAGQRELADARPGGRSSDEDYGRVSQVVTPRAGGGGVRAD